MDPTCPTFPLISVLIPSFNHAAFIENCLESVRLNHYPNLEIIFIDDGSTDPTFTVAKDWLEKNANSFHRVVATRQENQGLCKTLNRLGILAKGEYIAFLASDDELLPGSIQARMETLASNPNVLAV